MLFTFRRKEKQDSRPDSRPKEVKQHCVSTAVNSTFYAFSDSVEVEQNTDDCNVILDGHHGLNCDDSVKDKLEDKTVLPPNDDYGKLESD